MQTDVFILADHAQVSEGKLYISGGGWSRLTVNRVPYRKRVGLAIGLRIEPDEAGARHRFRVSMETPGDPTVLGEGEFQSAVFQGPSQVFLIAIDTEVNLESAGAYELILSVNGDETNRIGFEVVQAS